MKHLFILIGIVASFVTSSSIFAEGNHPHSDERDVMRVHRPNIEKDSLNTSHADKQKDARLDSRKMKSQIVTDTKVTREKYSENTPLSGKTQESTSHPLRTKRMGDH